MPVSPDCQASRYAQLLAFRSLRNVTLALVLSVTLLLLRMGRFDPATCYFLGQLLSASVA